MTENRHAQRVHTLCTACAPLVCLALAGAAQAGAAWNMFQARCLDPYEHLTEPVTDGLAQQLADQMRDAELVFAAVDGLLLVLDAAPDDGNRACAVHELGADMLDVAYLDWVADVTRRQIYVPEAGMLVSDAWIEPQVHVEASIDGQGVVYRVLETDLES
ncbi:hypothetical protein [uncultured Tateyamaria sp.]|uniref:hypothetical protein n=1 Tax=uncultured Tateyamaria sp. TaxID=455651 RepID=UPI0026203C32|nr:hypothetical protein [uncultured Tateyamaria sp.]